MCTCQTLYRCFAELRQLRLRSIRRLVSATVFQSLVAACIGSQRSTSSSVDFSRSRTQRHGSFSDSVVANCDHITDAVVSLHWLN